METSFHLRARAKGKGNTFLPGGGITLNKTRSENFKILTIGNMEDQKNNPNENIKITQVIPRDVREIQELLYETWLDTYPSKEFGILVSDIEFRFQGTFTDEALKKRADQIALHSPNENYICVKEKDKIIGVCLAIKHLDKNQLRGINVLPEYQRRGIGTLLWLEAQKFFDPAKDTFVEVAIYNTNAIEFYKKLGFKDTGKRFEDQKFRMQSGSIIPEVEMVKKAKSQS